MIKKKICMLGAFAVGKTSLVQQFAYGLFSDSYHTTVGVRIEKKVVSVDETNLNLMIWDLHGEDEFQEVRTSYVRGASGCLYVIDGTRRETVDTALELNARIDAAFPNLPAVVLLNKQDERSQWEITAHDRRRLNSLNRPQLEVSAKTADGVNEAFTILAEQILRQS